MGVEPPKDVDGPRQEGEEPKQEADGTQAEAPADNLPAAQTVTPVTLAPTVYAGAPVYTTSPTLLTSHATMPMEIGQIVEGGVNPQWSARYVYNGVEYTTFDAYHAGVKSHVENSAGEAAPAEEE